MTTLILHTIILISTGVVQTKELGVEERRYIFRKVLEKGLVFIMHKSVKSLKEKEIIITRQLICMQGV